MIFLLCALNQANLYIVLVVHAQDWGRRVARLATFFQGFGVDRGRLRLIFVHGRTEDIGHIALFIRTLRETVLAGCGVGTREWRIDFSIPGNRFLLTDSERDRFIAIVDELCAGILGGNTLRQRQPCV